MCSVEQFDAWCTSSMSSPKGRVTNASAHLQNKIFNYKWTIQNFGTIYQHQKYRNHKRITSDTFTVLLTEGRSLRFRVEMYPCGKKDKYKNYVTLSLRCLSNDDAKIASQMCVISNSGTKKYIKDSLDDFKDATNYYNCHRKFLSHFSFFGRDRDMLSALGTLTLAIKISIMFDKEDTTAKIKENHTCIMKEMLDKADDNLGDITIKCIDGEVSCHANILSAMSPHYKRMLATPMKESLTKTINMQATKATCLTILEYLYTGEVSVDKIDLEVYEEVDKMEMPNLMKQCSAQIIRKIDIKNCVATLMVAYLHNDHHLQKCAALFIVKNKEELSDQLKEKLVKEYSPLLHYLLMTKLE